MEATTQRALMPLDDVAIISKYNSEIRGLYNFVRSVCRTK